MSRDRDEFSSLMHKFTQQASSLALELDIPDVPLNRPLSSSIDSQATLPAGSTDPWNTAAQRASAGGAELASPAWSSQRTGGGSEVASASPRGGSVSPGSSPRRDSIMTAEEDEEADEDEDDGQDADAEDTEGLADTGGEESDLYASYHSPLLTVTASALGDDDPPSLGDALPAAAPAVAPAATPAARDAALTAHAARLERLQSDHTRALLAEANAFMASSLRDHESELQRVEDARRAEADVLRAEAAGLREELTRSRRRSSALQRAYNRRTAALIATQRRVWDSLVGSRSVRRVFDAWRQLPAERKARGVTEALAGRLGALRRKQAAFRSWKSALAALSEEKEERERQAHLEKILHGVVDRYETELRRLRAELSQAHAEVAEGVKRRRALEESLRTTLMRGMTGMQLEALDLFRRADSGAGGGSAESEPRKMVPRPTEG